VGELTELTWSEHERRRLVRLCALLTGDPAAADDLAQDTLLEAWRIRDRLTDPSGQAAWLDAIARNVCHRWRVRNARRGAHEVASDRPDEEPGSPHAGRDDLGEWLEQEELTELVDRALGLLPVDTRAALVGRYVDGLLPHQIAVRLGASPEAVSMRLTRGRARLRELLETTLADEPLAQAWTARHGVAWRATRLRCADCARATVLLRRDERAGVLELRCSGCDPSGVAAAYRLDNPELGARLAGVSRPSAVVARMAAWSTDFWPDAIAAGRAPCTRCGAAATVAPYVREDGGALRRRHGWHVGCPACGEELSTALGGLALAQPETRRLRQQRPHARAVPDREARWAGREALVVGYRDDGSGDGVDVYFDRRTTRLLAVVPVR
jgi:RNA polymerase sigma factor (sigma-70 family)